MTYYHKCKNCAIDPVTCDRRQSIKKAIKGLGLTSVKFTCFERVPLFQAGQRVSFDWSFWDESGRNVYGECEEDELTFSGTIVSEFEAQRRFLVRVDDVPVQSNIDPDAKYNPSDVFKNGGFAVKVKPSHIRILDEPLCPICPTCLGYEENERCINSEYCNAPDGALCKRISV